MNDDFLKTLSENTDFASLIKNLELSKNQILDNRFLIEEILEERKNNPNANITPIIVIGSDRLLYKEYITSAKGLAQKYIKNIQTQDVTKINLKIDLKDIDQTEERKQMGQVLSKITKNYKNMEKGFYVYGSLGRGKTFITQALAN
jgi:DNA replication protein DnaC